LGHELKVFWRGLERMRGRHGTERKGEHMGLMADGFGYSMPVKAKVLLSTVK